MPLYSEMTVETLLMWIPYIKGITLQIVRCVTSCLSPISWLYPGTHKTIILTSTKPPEQIWLVCAFLRRSNHRQGPSFSVIFTRRRPVSPQGHGLIDFYFHWIFPWSCLEQNFKKEEKENSSPLSAGKHKSLQRGPERQLLSGATERSK